MRISVVIRTLNEAQHLPDLLRMLKRQDLPGGEVEIVVVDSGSTDGTMEIAEAFGARLTTIAKTEFSFGRSLNRGCDFATGELLALISGHCVPVDDSWLRRLLEPLIAGQVSYAYGRQIGDDGSNFSERRIFAKYFPEVSSVPQRGFFCNNANSALSRKIWSRFRFDEELTGLEDMDLARRLVLSGHQIGYVAEAPVFHHHAESWPQVRRRFEREAIALRAILPEVELSLTDVLRCVASSTWGDWRVARRNGVRSTPPLDMLRYRWNQYLGSWRGNRQHLALSRRAKQDFFYPSISGKAEHDQWLKPLRRASPDEGQQSEG